MSIHIYTSKIKQLLGDDVRYSLSDDHTELNSVVATGIKGKKPHILKIDDYTEDNLISLVKKNNQVNHYKHLYVDYRFWNYKYCSPENLQTENLKWMMEIPPSDEPYIQTHMFYVGLVTVTIMYYSVIYHSLLVNDDVFKTYMSVINIDKNDFSRFLTHSSVYLPLTKNYLTLITRVFTHETIRDYLFPENGSFYTPDQVQQILEHFEVRDIQLYAKMICEMDDDLENKYHLMSVVFDLFNGSIDQHQKVFATDQMETKPVGYYLELMRPSTDSPKRKIEGDLDNLYQELIEKYSLLDGAETIEIF